MRYNFWDAALVGECAGATHLVTRMYLGGFALVRGDSSEVEAAASVFSLGGGAKSQSSFEHVQHAGDAESCQASRQSRTENAGCAAPLRLTLRPLLQAHECVDAKECAAACDGGTPDACVSLGGMYLQGKAVPRDPQQAARLFKRACDNGAPNGCGNLGQMYLVGQDIAQDFRLAGQLLEHACTRAVAWSCNSLAHMHAQGLGVPVDLIEAAELYQRACEGRDEIGCASSVNLLEELCERGSAHGCADLARLRFNGAAGVAADPAKAVAALERSCKARDASSCVSLAQSHMQGLGVTRNPAYAVALLEEACARGEARGCTALGANYAGLNGDGVPLDDKKAFDLFQKGCDLGDRDACGLLAMMHGEGRGTPKDTSRALSIARDACDNGQAISCSWLASAHEDGDGVPVDVAKARALYKRSCDGGFEDACRSVERLDLR